MATHSLLIRSKGVAKTPEKLERLTFSIKNLRPVPIYVSLNPDGLNMGFCHEFSSTSLPMFTYADSFNGRWRTGRLLQPGEESEETVVAGVDCLRADYVVNFVGYFNVGYEPAWIRAEGFGLGNIYFKSR